MRKPQSVGESIALMGEEHSARMAAVLPVLVHSARLMAELPDARNQAKALAQLYQSQPHGEP
jgi:hypothetical protein